MLIPIARLLTAYHTTINKWGQFYLIAQPFARADFGPLGCSAVGFYKRKTYEKKSERETVDELEKGLSGIEKLCKAKCMFMFT